MVETKGADENCTTGKQNIELKKEHYVVLDNGRVVHLNQIKAIYTAWGESLLLGGRRFYFIELPGLFRNKRIEVSRNDYERLMEALESDAE